jgi:hypothetical protein
MNQKRAKAIKKIVFDSMYGETPKSEKRKIYKDKNFKKIYRARKKNFIRGLVAVKQIGDAI